MRPFLNERILNSLTRADRVFLCTHIAPDGDAIGSLLAMKLVLEGMGKTAVACCADPVPVSLQPLPGAREVLQPEQVTGTFDAALSLDAADLGRIGSCRDVYERAPVRLQIDHHGSNPAYADENEIDAGAAATGCLVVRLMKALDIPMTRETAACLYAAVSTDTGNFSFPNANSEVFEVMAELTRTGFDLGFWSRQLHLMRDPGHLGLLARALSRLTFLHGGLVTTTMVLPQDYADCHARPEHSENIVNYGMYIPGVKMTCFVNSREEGVTKFSLRALPPYSAMRAVQPLGGGGHEAAAGVTLQMPVDQALEKVLRAIEEEIQCHP